MLKNYVTITIRNLLKNATYSLINIAGLSIGIVCSILILLWVDDEVSYDSFLPKGDKLQQVWANAKFDGKINSWRSVPLPTYEAMKTADANIVNSVNVDWGGEHLLSWNNKRLLKDGYFVSEEFLEMFEFPLLIGDATTVLDDPTSIVITESLAKILFGDEDPMDKIVKVDNESELKVTGILKDLPSNSSFEFDYLLTYKLRQQVNEWVVNNKDNWGNYSFQVFVELNDAANKDLAEEGIKDILTENGEDDIEREFFLHPMSRWRLYSDFENGKALGSMSDYVKLFTIIAIFILVIACINFMNLATARSEHRAREVGIRKSMGSNRIELILQFMGESLFISLISFCIAILLAELLLPAYNNLVDKSLFIDYMSSEFWLFSTGLILVTGLLSGSYPAFYLSSFKPVVVLKGKVNTGKGASTPRKVLVTIQFGFSIFLIIGMIVIFGQIQLVKKRDLGYNQENLITIDKTEEIHDNYQNIKLELEQSGFVESMARSNSPVTSIQSNNFLGWPGKPEELRVIFTTIATEYDYAKTMGVKLLMGRDFSEDFKSDTAAIIINKAALDLMGLEDPIGTQLDLWGGKRTLIGVTDNMLMGSLYTKVRPAFMILDKEWTGSVTVRLKGDGNIQPSLKKVEEVFNKYNSAYPFEYSFADEDFAKKFTTINMTSKLSALFALLTIAITGLGLFGLASYMAEQKTKEIGIRKVLGASTSSLVGLVSKEFSLLVLIAFVCSAPIAWWLLNMYLDRYPIRVSIAWWVFPLTGIIALVFALMVVSKQAFKAARANPAQSLRSE